MRTSNPNPDDIRPKVVKAALRRWRERTMGVFGAFRGFHASNELKANPPPVVLTSEAAATLAWSFRELFKHRLGLPGNQLSASNCLGFGIANALAVNAPRKHHEAFLRHPLGLPAGSDMGPQLDDCATLLRELGDPVIDALWGIGTLRSLSDLLAHLVLRAENPQYVLWNTADYARLKHGICLYTINKAHFETLNRQEDVADTA
jgi:hypothetical protein